MSRDGRATPRMSFWQAVADRGILMRGLTYAVPFGVSTYSAAQHKRHRGAPACAKKPGGQPATPE